MSFCLPGRWQICPTSRPFLAAHAMFAPVVGGFNKSDWRLGAQPFKYTLNWKILEDFDWNILTDPKNLLRSKSCFTLENQLKTKPFSSRKLQRVGTRWTESVPSLGSCCRGTRPNGIKSTSLPGRKSGKLTNRKSACLKNAAYKKPTNSNVKVHDWVTVRMIEIPQIPQPFGLSTWSRHSLANILFDLGEPGSEVVSEWKLWHVVSWKSFS